MKGKFTAEEVDWLKANYFKLGMNKCAKIMERSPSVVGFKARSMGLSCPRGSYLRRQLDPVLVVKAYESLRTIDGVAKHFKSSEDTISKILKKAGISGRTLTSFQKHQDAIVAEYLAGNTTYKTIADKYGVSKDQIRYGLRELGVVDATRKGRFPNRKSTYESWVAKYGKDEADKRWIEYKKKLYKNARRGEANHRFGKPPSQGTGNGWKGWYRGLYFRSLREAMFMINAERDGVEWKTAETKEYMIHYTFKNKACTYRPDFIVGRDLLELKPVKLHCSPRVTAKKLAAEAFCKERGLTYLLEDIEINKDQIYEALKDGRIKFDRDYEARFLTYVTASLV